MLLLVNRCASLLLKKKRTEMFKKTEYTILRLPYTFSTRDLINELQEFEEKNPGSILSPPSTETNQLGEVEQLKMCMETKKEF